MTDRALLNAEGRRNALMERIETLDREVEALRAELNEIDTFIRSWHQFAGTECSDEEIPVVRKRAKAGRPSAEAIAKLKRAARRHDEVRHRSVNPPKEEVAKAVREILETEGRPLVRSDIMKRLNERGMTIRGTNPDVVLSTMLWRVKDEIAHLKGMGYWLTDRPLPFVTLSEEDAGHVEDDRQLIMPA